jgi:transposase
MQRLTGRSAVHLAVDREHRMEIAPTAMLVGAGLLLLGFCLRAPIMIALFGSLAFGSTAIAMLPAIGGATVLLYVPFAGLLVASVLFRRTLWSDLARVFALHWIPATITLLLAYAVLSALIFPRLFAGRTTVFVPSQGAVIETVLMPVSGNLNQTGYFCIGALTFFAMSMLLLRERGFRSVRAGFLTFAVLHSILGLIDLTGKAAGVGDILSPIRTAGYTMLVDVQVEGFWRIAGGYSEASAFGGASLIALAFAFSYWRSTGSRPILVLWLLLLLLLLLSTSTTAYAGLAVLLLIFAISWLGRLLTGRLSRRDVAVLFVAGAVSATVLGIFLFGEGTLDPTNKLIEATLLEKSTSASAGERFYWNRKNWMAFLDTYGVGVGLGSSRASSLFIAILSQLGIVGALLFGLLFLEIAKRPARTFADPRDGELVAMCGALRSAGAATIIAGAISGGGADPGILFYIIVAGLLVGRARLSAGAALMERRAVMEQSWRHGGPWLGRAGYAPVYEPAEHGFALARNGPMLTRLSEADWAMLVKMFRACLPRRGGKARDDRKFLEALLYFRVHNLSWRALPKGFGNWNSIWKRYWRLSRTGVFEDFLARLTGTGRTAHLAQLFHSDAIRAARGAKGAGGPED